MIRVLSTSMTSRVSAPAAGSPVSRFHRAQGVRFMSASANSAHTSGVVRKRPVHLAHRVGVVVVPPVEVAGLRRRIAPRERLDERPLDRRGARDPIERLTGGIPHGAQRARQIVRIELAPLLVVVGPGRVPDAPPGHRAVGVVAPPPAGSSAPLPRGRTRSTTRGPGRTSAAPRPIGWRPGMRRSRDRSRSRRSRCPPPSVRRRCAYRPARMDGAPRPNDRTAPTAFELPRTRHAGPGAASPGCAAVRHPSKHSMTQSPAPKTKSRSGRDPLHSPPPSRPEPFNDFSRRG